MRPIAAARRSDTDLVAILIGVVFAVIWSSAFTSAKIALQDAPPFLILVFRFLISGGLGVAIAVLVLRQRLPRQMKTWAMIAFLGLCQNSLYLGLNFFAMTRVPAGMASVIASTMPLFVCILGVFLVRDRLEHKTLLGLGLGFGGVLMIMANQINTTDGTLIGYGACVVGVIALAIATLVVRSFVFDTGLMMMVGLQMVLGGLFLVPPMILFGESLGDVNWTLSLGLSFTYTTLIPGLVATLMWFHLIERIGATKASVFHFLNPAFGVAIAWALLSEPVGFTDMLGVVVATFGILLVQLARGKMV